MAPTTNLVAIASLLASATLPSRAPSIHVEPESTGNSWSTRDAANDLATYAALPSRYGRAGSDPERLGALDRYSDLTPLLENALRLPDGDRELAVRAFERQVVLCRALETLDSLGRLDSAGKNTLSEVSREIRLIDTLDRRPITLYRGDQRITTIEVAPYFPSHSAPSLQMALRTVLEQQVLPPINAWLAKPDSRFIDTDLVRVLGFADWLERTTQLTVEIAGSKNADPAFTGIALELSRATASYATNAETLRRQDNSRGSDRVSEEVRTAECRQRLTEVKHRLEAVLVRLEKLR